MSLNIVTNKKPLILKYKSNTTLVNQIKELLTIYLNPQKPPTNFLYDTLNKYKEDYVSITSSNINSSLDLINNRIEEKDKINLINELFQTKHVPQEFKFNNINFYVLIDTYKNIVNSLFQSITNCTFVFNTLFNFNDLKENPLNFLKNTNTNIINLLEYLKRKKYYNIELIDIYLLEFYSVPSSSSNIMNFIYFLRRFPLFICMINKYFFEYEKDIFEKLTEYNIDNISCVNDNTANIDLFLNSPNYDIKIYNLKSLLDGSISINNIIYTMPCISQHDIKTKNIINYINEFRNDVQTIDLVNRIIRTNTYGVIKLHINHILFNPKQFFTECKKSSVYKNYKGEDKTITLDDFEFILYLYSFYLCLEDMDTGYLSTLQLDDLMLNLSDFLINLFSIYNYLNLDIYDTIEMLQKTYPLNEISENSVMLNDPGFKFYKETAISRLIFYIHASYFLFNKKNSIYEAISDNMNILKHFFYTFNYFKNDNQKIFPLFVFLGFSDKNTKIIKEYNSSNNLVLDWLIDYYDVLFKHPKKYVIKN